MKLTENCVIFKGVFLFGKAMTTIDSKDLVLKSLIFFQDIQHAA